MEPRYYDAAGHIAYPTIKAYAADLRLEAVNAFWSAMAVAAAPIRAKLCRSTPTDIGGSAAHALAVIHAPGASRSR